MSADTKSRILDAALALFNAQGTSNVTTNHIAEALGMSPAILPSLSQQGRDRARAVFPHHGRMGGQLRNASRNHAQHRHDGDHGGGQFRIQARYRFFFRDLTLLLNADPELASAYRANRAAGIGNTKFLINLFAEAGVLKPMTDDEALDDLAQLLWLAGDFWLVFKDTGGAVFSPADTEQGVRLFRRLLAPHLKGDVK